MDQEPGSQLTSRYLELVRDDGKGKSQAMCSEITPPIVGSAEPRAETCIKRFLAVDKH